MEVSGHVHRISMKIQTTGKSQRERLERLVRCVTNLPENRIESLVYWIERVFSEPEEVSESECCKRCHGWNNGYDKPDVSRACISCPCHTTPTEEWIEKIIEEWTNSSGITTVAFLRKQLAAALERGEKENQMYATQSHERGFNSGAAHERAVILEAFEQVKGVKEGGCDGCDYNLEMLEKIRSLILARNNTDTV